MRTRGSSSPGCCTLRRKARVGESWYLRRQDTSLCSTDTGSEARGDHGPNSPGDFSDRARWEHSTVLVSLLPGPRPLTLWGLPLGSWPHRLSSRKVGTEACTGTPEVGPCCRSSLPGMHTQAQEQLVRGRGLPAPSCSCLSPPPQPACAPSLRAQCVLGKELAQLGQKQRPLK